VINDPPHYATADGEVAYPRNPSTKHRAESGSGSGSDVNYRCGLYATTSFK